MSYPTPLFCHGDLLPGLDSIRLLHLLPSEHEDADIHCELFNYRLQELNERTHPYNALSYVWGKSDNSQPLPTIRIDGSHHPVTSNLHDALARLRHRYFGQIVWVDAICINQGNVKEKEKQIQLMAKIYSQANCVVVWLGKAADKSSQALEEIRIAGGNGGKMSTNSSNTEAIGQAVLALLKRPWFQRIWVLQEVAAARHIVMICGPTEIDGYAFCLGVESINKFHQASVDLQSLIRSVTYLMRGSIFRPKGSGEIFLDICSLGELIDMYHTHGATECHDKVFALLGMSSNILSDLPISYGVPWEELLQRIVKFLLGKNISVKTLGDKRQIAIIKSKGCILGRVFSTRSGVTLDGRQGLGVVLTTTFGQSGDFGERNVYWTLQTSAKSIEMGDVICLLEGALKPMIIRLREDDCTILVIAATPLQNIPKKSGLVEWSNNQQLVNLLPTRNFQLVWDWENSPEKSQGLGDYEKSESSLDKATRLWNFALVLSGTGNYERAEKKFREAIKSYETVFAEEHLYMVADILFLGDTATLDLIYSQYGRTLLSWAAEEGHKTVVELLLGEGEIDVNCKDMDGRTPLLWAAEGGHLAIVKQLLQKKAEINAGAGRKKKAALEAAAGGGHLAIVEELLQEKADVNAPAGFEGRTALQAAAEGGHLAIIERLLQEKADVNAPAAAGDGGRTALQAAAEGGHFAIVERLLQKKADVNAAAAGFKGRTALQAAAEGGHFAIVERLLQKKADVNAPAAAGDGGRTALQAAAEGGHLVAVKRLLQKKADVNAAAAGYRGRTALQAAAEGGHFAIVERLLQKKADVNAAAAGFEGRTALQAAAEGGHFAIVERLLQEKADVNAVAAGFEGRTALQAAAAGDHFAIVERLLQEKADVHAKGGGRTALQEATARGRSAVVKRLQQAGAKF